MTRDQLLRNLRRPLGAAELMAVAAASLLLLHAEGSRLKKAVVSVRADETSLAATREPAEAQAGELSGMVELKRHDAARMRDAAKRRTRSEREFFEAGLSLQEEKRLLEKQLEVMSTYLLIDEEERRVRLMRGDQTLEAYPIATPAVALGGVSALAPTTTSIISKERFAHPERGRSEEVDGKLEWVPPQVGDSARAKALGEFVVFFKGDLVLHGPTQAVSGHAAFPHWCVGLGLPTARRLYQATFIGTKAVFKRAGT